MQIDISKPSAKNHFAKKDNSIFFGPAAENETPFFAPRIQTKLTIGRPGDKYEQEADNVADRVVQRLSNPQATAPAVQRKCPGCEEKEKLQRKEAEEEREAPEVTRKEEDEEEATPDGAASPSPSLESRLSSAKGSGAPMDKSTRQPMEAAFGQDFSRVRIHTNSGAAQMNRELNARAFTHGRDIYFNAGGYSPGSTEGRRLLAHELVHVGQQEEKFKYKNEFGHSNFKIQKRGSAPQSNKTNFHKFTIKVNAKKLDYSSGLALFRSMTKKGDNVGHTWIVLKDKFGNLIEEGGHTGEEGSDTSVPGINDLDKYDDKLIRDKNKFESVPVNFRFYKTGIISLIRIQKANFATPLIGLPEHANDPKNPVKWLWHIYQDGKWAKPSNGKQGTPNFEKTWNLTDAQFNAVKKKIAQIKTGIKAYGFTKMQCTSTAAEIAKSAKIILNAKVGVNIQKYYNLGGYRAALWTNNAFSRIEFATPDKMKSELQSSNTSS